MKNNFSWDFSTLLLVLKLILAKLLQIIVEFEKFKSNKNSFYLYKISFISTPTYQHKHYI